MRKKEQDYAAYRTEWLERDAVKEWTLSRPGVVAMVEHMVELIGPLDGLKILDAGCKEGWTGDYLKGRFLGVEMTSVELLEKFVEYAKEQGRDHVVQGSVCDLPQEWEQKFDLVICRHVLGLVEDAKRAFEELHRVSRKWVYMITHVPGNESKHYCYLEKPNTLLEWFGGCLGFDLILMKPNPKQFREQDKRRVEYVVCTKRRNFTP